MKHPKQPSKLLKPAVLALAIVAVFVSGAFTPLEPAMVVVIDAGHGGKDPGNLGTGRYSLTEKDVTLDVSNKLAEYITDKMPDVKVILTRTDDSFPKLNSRVKIANNANADVYPDEDDEAVHERLRSVGLKIPRGYREVGQPAPAESDRVEDPVVHHGAVARRATDGVELGAHAREGVHPARAAGQIGQRLPAGRGVGGIEDEQVPAEAGVLPRAVREHAELEGVVVGAPEHIELRAD